MENERFQIWINFAQFFIGTFALGVVTLLVNNRIQEREVEIKEQEQIGTLVEEALDANVEARLRLARFYSTVTRSDTIRVRWEEYRGELETEYKLLNEKVDESAKTIKKLEEANASSIEIEKEKKKFDSYVSQVTPRSVLVAERALPSRVYFHINNNSQRDRASELSRYISKPNELVVPGIQLLNYSPERNELRYFRHSERAEAERIADAIKTFGVEAKVTYISGHEDNKNLRPRHFELWISSMN